MRTPPRFVSVALILSAALLVANVAQAMEIWQFDKMAVPDQGDYVGLLIAGAERVLNDEGRADLAAKVVQLFATTEPGDKATLGMVEFIRNLPRARLADARNLAKNPHARRIEVEDAMAVTLKKNGIDLPQSFFSVGKDFKPKLSPTTATPPPKSAVLNTASNAPASQPPMITNNPDGTFTVQKVPPKGSKDNDKGLVIPPQVVVPFVPAVGKKP